MSILSKMAQEESKLEMTPMIDVTFLLLIFFMCTIKFKTLEGKLAAYLPKDVGVNTSQAEPIEKVEIQVRVLAEGSLLDPRSAKALNSRDPGRVAPYVEGQNKRFVYGNDRVIEYSVGPFKTTDIDKLQERLVSIHKEDAERPATIDPRKGTVYEDVVHVLDAALNAQFKEVTFVGSYE